MRAKIQGDESGAEPTRSELEILKVLWEYGPLTVRQVNNILNEKQREVQYTSTLKLMQIMLEKQLLTRNADSMTHIYAAAVEEGKTKGELLDKFVSNLFEGSASKLILQLLGNKKTLPGELEAIRKMLDEMEKRKAN